MTNYGNKADNGDIGSEGIPTARYDGAAVGPGEQIGPYKLLRILGEGGYGIVYLAEQQRPVKRRVALKVIKPGMDTNHVIARFEAERQALALLDHPNIAHVFNAGTTDAGRPYFAMEYVKGVPITEHCDRYKLTIEERLKLFMTICEAVQHAHQKAIIHRDIKPSNILVAYEGEQAVPLIIDFGVAKALSQSLTDRTLVTEQAQMIGTPEYMSPEQAEMTSQDIDTRTDIYSLGVLLYELLTGTLPFDSQTLREGGPERMRRMIREQDPQTPSARLSTIEHKESLSLAEHRHTDMRSLGHHLHGELDWITLKAMDKDRMRRYQTAHALAEDIQRYLNQEPVLAGPPSTIYKARKFIKRNKVLFTSSVAIAVILILAVIVSTQQALVARKARKAESVERKAAQVERDKAQQAEQQAQENLYDSLVREAHATRIARRTGYRDEVFNALKQAIDLDVPQKDPVELRREATACLGDFVGLSPTILGEFPEDPTLWRAALHPNEPIAALALADGTVLLREVSSLTDIARFDGLHPPQALCFSASGNVLLSLHAPKASTVGGLSPDTVARFWVRTSDGAWGEGKTVKTPGAAGCRFTTNGFYVGLVDKESHRIEIRNLDSGATVYRLRYPEQMDYPPIIDVSPDGRFLAAAIVEPNNPKSSLLDIWDITTGQRARRLNTGFAVTTTFILQFSSDARYLAFFSGSGGAIYTTDGFELIDRLSEHFEANRSGVCFLSASTTIAFSVVEQNRIRLWDWAKREYLATLESEGRGSVWLETSADGKFLLTYDQQRAYVYAIGHSDEKLALSGHPASVPGISFSPDGSRLASVGKDRKLRVWNADTGLLAWERALVGLGQSVAYSPDGRWLLTTEFDSEGMCIWNPETTEKVFEMGHDQDGGTWSAQLSADGRHLVTAAWYTTSGRGVTVWQCDPQALERAETGNRATVLKSFPGKAKGLSVAPDGRHFAFVVPEWPKMKLYQWEFTRDDAPRLLSDNVQGGPQIFAYTPTSRELLTLDPNRSVVTYDANTGRKVTSFPTIDPNLVANWPSGAMLSLSPDGTTVALSSSSLRAVDLWHRESGRLLYTLPERSGTVYWFAWSPDSTRLAVARSNGDINIWSLTEIKRVLAGLGLAP